MTNHTTITSGNADAAVSAEVHAPYVLDITIGLTGPGVPARPQQLFRSWVDVVAQHLGDRWDGTNGRWWYGDGDLRIQVSLDGVGDKGVDGQISLFSCIDDAILEVPGDANEHR